MDTTIVQRDNTWKLLQDNYSGKDVTGAGVLPVSIDHGVLHVLLQHEVSHRKPMSAKNFGLTDFGGGCKQSDGSVMHSAAREFSEELNFGFQHLVGAETNPSDVIKRLSACACIFSNNRYVIYFLPCKFIPTCVLARGLLAEDYKAQKKIQLLYWVPLPFVLDPQSWPPIHERVACKGISVKLRAVEQTLKLLGSNDVSDVHPLEFNWKEVFRRCIWESMSTLKLVTFPSPCDGRIPNFVGADCAAHRLSTVDAFRCATVVKVNPSLAQTMVRSLVVTQGKTLLVPSPALETVFMYQITPHSLSQSDRSAEPSKTWVRRLGRPLSVARWPARLLVDVVVVAAVAVCPHTGRRVGKGRGYGDLEWALLTELGAVGASTLVATTVHDCQVLPDLGAVPQGGYGGDDHGEAAGGGHDLPVDVVATPTRLLWPPRRAVRPAGRVDWAKVTPEALQAIPALQELQQLQRKHAGGGGAAAEIAASATRRRNFSAAETASTTAGGADQDHSATNQPDRSYSTTNSDQSPTDRSN